MAAKETTTEAASSSWTFLNPKARPPTTTLDTKAKTMVRPPPLFELGLRKNPKAKPTQITALARPTQTSAWETQSLYPGNPPGMPPMMGRDPNRAFWDDPPDVSSSLTHHSHWWMHRAGANHSSSSSSQSHMLAQRAVEDSIAAAPGRNTTPVPSQSPTMLAQMAVEDSIAAAPWRNTTPVHEATSNDSEETHESEATSSANEETHEVDKPIGTPLETALAPMWDEKPPYNTRKAKCDRSRMASNVVNTVAAYRRQHIEGNINPVVTKGRFIVPEERLEEAINAATFDPQLCRIMPTMRPPITPTRWSPPSWRHQAKKICRQWEQGKCKYGERCQFGHEWPDREADEQHNIATAKWWGQVPPRALGALPLTMPATKPTTQVPDLDTVPPWHNNDQMKSRGRPPPSFNGLAHVMSKTVSLRKPIIDEDNDMIETIERRWGAPTTFFHFIIVVPWWHSV